MRYMAGKFVAVILTLCISTSFLSGCNNKENTKQETGTETINVEVEQAEIQDIQVLKEFPGKLKAYQEIMVLPKIPGKILKVHVKVGQAVQKDDLLIELDGSDVELQLNQAQASYNSAKLSVDLSRQKLNDLKTQKVELDDAINSISNSIKEFDKNMQKADPSGNGQKSEPGLSLSAGKQALPGLQAADSPQDPLAFKRQELNQKLVELEAARRGIENAIKQLPYNEDTLDAQLKQAKIGFDMAMNSKNNLRLLSPITGIVSSLTAETGGMVGQTMAPVSVIDIKKMVMDINLSEYDINKVQAGQKIKVFVDAVQEEALEGEIEWVGPSADARSQSYPVRIVVNNTKESLKPGMFARAALVMDTRSDAVTVAKNSILREQGSYYIFVTKEDKVIKKEVRLGLENRGRIEILSGISSEDTVVVKGQEYLSEDSTIQIVRGDT